VTGQCKKFAIPERKPEYTEHYGGENADDRQFQICKSLKVIRVEPFVSLREFFVELREINTPKIQEHI
jgi:hypothetical protein